MDLDALDGYHRLQRAERLVLELTEIRAIDRVGAPCTEGLDVEQLRALADLLVHGERDPQLRSRKLRVRGEVCDDGHDDRDPGLVVGAEQCVAAARDEIVTALPEQLRDRGGIQPGTFAGKLQHVAGVALVHDRLDTGARRVGTGVDVRDQADHRNFRTMHPRGLDRGSDVSVRVLHDIGASQRSELIAQHRPELQLARAAGGALVLATGLCVDSHIALKAAQQVPRKRCCEPGSKAICLHLRAA